MPFYINAKKLEAEIAKRVAESCDEITMEMGAEIHDDLIQKLSIFRLYINRIESSANDPEEIKNLAIKMRGDFQNVIHSVRHISQRLFPSYFDGDSFIERLRSLCKNMQQPGVGHIHFESKGVSRSLENISELHLLRIVQELIHNSIKHSSAWHIWVRLIFEISSITVEVEDDGIGDTKIEESIDRLKKRNNTLKLRVQAVGGTISFMQGLSGLLAKVTLVNK
jgi:two-component system NarL family sensor kinase